MNPMRYARLIVFLFALTSAGCGYHVLGGGGDEQMTAFTGLDGSEPLAIPFFDNRSSKPYVESVITAAFAEEFMRSVDLTADAATVLKGTVSAYKLRPLAFTENDIVSEYRVTVRLDLVVERDGEAVWGEVVEDYEDFAVTTSSVVETKDAEAKAVRKMASDMARIVKERIVGGL